MITTEKVIEQLQSDGTIKYFIRTRQFLGKTGDFKTRDEQSFENRHLKAYLHGDKSFRFRYKTVTSNLGDKREIAWFDVKEDQRMVEITAAEVDQLNKKINRLKHDSANRYNNR